MRAPKALAVAACFAPLVACVPEAAVPCPQVPVATPAPASPSASLSSPTPTPTPTPTATSTSTATATATPTRAAAKPPPAFEQAIGAAQVAIATGDYATADQELAAATTVAGADPHLRYVVARYRATRFAYAGDFESAATAMLSVIPDLARHPESSDEFWAHNGMMMIREAAGDPAAALAEDDQATIAASRGTWEPEERETLAYLKDRWHRAYLTRMLAATRSGSARQELVRYAEAALDDYRARARELGTNADSVAVLEAYFAALDGNREAALRAAKKVDPAKDDDIEDLYLVVVGLEAGGDHGAAEAVKKVMRQPSGPHLARPIMLRWLDHDAKKPGDHVFTPWHPS